MSGTVSARLMGTLDEKFISSAEALATMVNHATFLLDGRGLRRTDGSLDEEAISGRIERLSWRFPPMRQRLMPSPLGITTPAWVPVTQLRASTHVRFLARDDDADEAYALSGLGLPPLDLTEPPWDITVLDLGPERIALVVRIHHVMGDGILLARLLTALTDPSPDAGPPLREATVEAGLGRPPRNGPDLLLHAFSSWWQEQSSASAAWREYWRKPFQRRIRRWAGRLRRRLGRGGQAPTLTAGSSAATVAYVSGEFGTLKANAATLAGSVNDLIVAATLAAASELNPNRTDVAILVPYSRRRPPDARNHVSMARVSAPRGSSMKDLIPLSARTLRLAILGKLPPESPDDVRASGYATIVPWQQETRYFGPARVLSLIGWPTVDAGDQLGCLATTYDGEVMIAMRSRTAADIVALQTHLQKIVTAEPGLEGP